MARSSVEAVGAHTDLMPRSIKRRSASSGTLSRGTSAAPGDTPRGLAATLLPHGPQKTDAIAVCTLSAVVGALRATASTTAITSSVLTSQAAESPMAPCAWLSRHQSRVAGALRQALVHQTTLGQLPESRHRRSVPAFPRRVGVHLRVLDPR